MDWGLARRNPHRASKKEKEGLSEHRVPRLRKDPLKVLHVSRDQTGNRIILLRELGKGPGWQNEKGTAGRGEYQILAWEILKENPLCSKEEEPNALPS